MGAALVLALSLAVLAWMAFPGPSDALLRGEAEARAAQMAVAHQAAADSVAVSGNPGPGRLPDGFVAYPDWFHGQDEFVSGSDGTMIVATWMAAEPRLWGEVSAALGRRKPGKAAVGVVDRSGAEPVVVGTFEGKPTRFTGLGASLSGAPDGAPAVVSTGGTP